MIINIIVNVSKLVKSINLDNVMLIAYCVKHFFMCTSKKHFLLYKKQ